ncbi:hypothetical protein DN523_13650 [Burkholderia multivorans]|uniref:Putative lipoprotein n=1 Tax=Burkholderia multivorans CGD2 TaxID=513052 RepID=B9BSS8_9BURK|nr:hypothetical protein A8H40_18605 [Burkholderia multivorans]EEE06148.1 putative lipoprotein [Burkholderia multivorans CGD2]EEE11399.1 putative lipoprotein [Burkholderia multivorans CGD2M]PRD89146.1 hypothetical protein C6P76_07400 [Burkholderia multivorans]PRE04859.1 hypothetical protein C6P91_15905 [Burkholderia multivorans]
MLDLKPLHPQSQNAVISACANRAAERVAIRERATREDKRDPVRYAIRIICNRPPSRLPRAGRSDVGRCVRPVRACLAAAFPCRIVNSAGVV